MGYIRRATHIRIADSGTPFDCVDSLFAKTKPALGEENISSGKLSYLGGILSNVAQVSLG